MEKYIIKDRYIIENRSGEHGKQFIYRFPNGYGGSVIQNVMYGGDVGKEL